MPVEGNAQGCGAPDQATLVVLHPVHSQAEQQQTDNLEDKEIKVFNRGIKYKYA